MITDLLSVNITEQNELLTLTFWLENFWSTFLILNWFTFESGSSSISKCTQTACPFCKVHTRAQSLFKSLRTHQRCPFGHCPRHLAALKVANSMYTLKKRLITVARRVQISFANGNLLGRLSLSVTKSLTEAMWKTAAKGSSAGCSNTAR